MLIGIIIGMILFFLISITVKQVSKKKLTKKDTNNSKVNVKLTDEQKKKLEETKNAFDNLMNYDYEIAVRKVTK